MRNRLIATTIAVAVLSGAVFAGQPRNDDNRRPGGDRPGFSRRDDSPGPDRRPPHRGRFGQDGFGPMHMMGQGMGGHRGGMGMGAPMHRLARLDLTTEQKTKIVDVLTANYKAMLEAKFMMADAATKVRDARKGNLDEDAIIAAHRDMGEASGRLQALRGKAVEQIKAILTAEQKTELDNFSDRRGRSDGRQGMRMRPDRRDRDDDRRMGQGPRHGQRRDDRRWDDRRPRDRWDAESRWDRRPPRHHRWGADMDDVIMRGDLDDDTDDDTDDDFEDEMIED